MTNGYTDQDIKNLGPGFKTRGFEQVWRAIGRLPFISNDGPYAWRGVPDSSFGLSPSLYRKLKTEEPGASLDEETMRSKEKQILAEAREWGLGRIGTTLISDLQLLAILQHHSVPTRLLDVSSDPLTALWFACAAYPDRDGLLMALNLSEYEVIASEGNPDTWGSVGDPTGWHLQNALDKSTKSALPHVLRPTFFDQRMTAQAGFFIMSAVPDVVEFEYREVPRPDVEGLFMAKSPYIPEGAAYHMLFDEQPEFERYRQAIWAFVISAESKKNILTALESNFNRTARSLFPDAAGFSAYASTLR